MLTSNPVKTEIELQTGSPAQREKLQNYFGGIFEAEKTGEQFPVNLDHVWRIGYSRKNNAVAALSKNFLQDVDYQVLLQPQQNPLGGRPEEIYMLTVSCLEYFVVRANRDVFDVYRECRQAIQQQVLAYSALPATDDTIGWIKYALKEAEESKAKDQLLLAAKQKEQELEETIQVVQPKVQHYDDFMSAEGLITLQAAGKDLKLGSQKFMTYLKDEKYIQKVERWNARGCMTYARWENSGLFENKSTVSEGVGKTGNLVNRIYHTVYLTAKGMEYFQKKMGK